MATISRSAAKKRFEAPLEKVAAAAEAAIAGRDAAEFSSIMKGVAEHVLKWTGVAPDQWLVEPVFPTVCDDGSHYVKPKRVEATRKLALFVDGGVWDFHAMDMLYIDHLRGRLTDDQLDHRSYALIVGLLVLFDLYRRRPHDSP